MRAVFVRTERKQMSRRMNTGNLLFVLQHGDRHDSYIKRTILCKLNNSVNVSITPMCYECRSESKHPQEVREEQGKPTDPGHGVEHSLLLDCQAAFYY